MNNKSQKTKESFQDKMIKYNDKHPKFRKYMDIVEGFMEKMFVLYWIMVALSVAIPVLLVYYTFPLEVRDEVSGLIGGVLSLIIIPLALNYINKKTENTYKIFDENKSLYMELTEILISLLTTQDENFKENSYILKQFICNNYSLMCVAFPSSLIWDICYIYKECEYKNNEENQINNEEIIKYYIQKCLREIRKQAGLTRKFYLNNQIIELLREEVQDL